MKKQLGPIWNQQWPPQSWLLLTVVVISSCISICSTAPVHETTDLEQYPGTCYYNYNHYNEGDRILTNEPCLNCTCHNQMLMCYLRVCPFTKPIGHDCVVEKREDQCCPIITCPDVPVELVDHKSDSKNEVGFAEKYGCYIEEKFYPEGAQVPSNPNKPCELCYCIRNRTSCLMQECTLHVDGCQPIYNRGVCCPVRYDCEHDSMIGGPYLEDSHTTVRPTEGFILTTLPSTKESSSCVYNDVTFADGALIPDTKPCEHCYCMKGDIVCAVQECAVHIEHTDGKNCTFLPPPAGECCPESYICQDDEAIHKIEEDVHDLVSPHVDEAITTTAQPIAIEAGEVESATELGEDLHHKLHETVSEEDVQLQEHIDDVLKTTAEPTDAESGLGAIETTTAGLGANIKFAQDSEAEGQEATTQLPELSELPSETEGELPQILESETKAPIDSSVSPLDFATEIPDKSEQGFEQEATPSTDGLETPALTPNEIVPMAIPGEGDCLYNKVTYRNNSDVPNITKCDEYCMCISSIIKCRKVQCAIALGPNCRLAENQDPEACCPTYYCDGEDSYEQPKGEESLATTLPPSSVEQGEDTTAAAVDVFEDRVTEGHEAIPEEPEQPTQELLEPVPTIKPEAVEPHVDNFEVQKEHDLSSGDDAEEAHTVGESATETQGIAGETTPKYVSQYDHTEAIPVVSEELPSDQITEEPKQEGAEEEQGISDEKLPSESFETAQPTETPQESTEQNAGALPGGIEHGVEPELHTERGPSSSEQEPHVDHSKPAQEEPEIQTTASPAQPEALDIQQPATGGLEPAHKVDKLPEEHLPEESIPEEPIPEDNLPPEQVPEEEADIDILNKFQTPTTEKNVEEEVEGEQLAQDVTEKSSETDHKRIQPIPEIIETTSIPAIESMSHVTDAIPIESEEPVAEHVTQKEVAIEENTTIHPRIEAVPQGQSDVELEKPIEQNEIIKEEQPQSGLPEEPAAVLPSSEPEIDNELTTDELMSAVLDILKGTDTPIIVEPEAPVQPETTEKIIDHEREDHTEVSAESLPEIASEELIPEKHLPEEQTEQSIDEKTQLPIDTPEEPSQQSPDASGLPVYPQLHEKPAEENIIEHGIEEQDKFPQVPLEELPEQGQGQEQLPEQEKDQVIPEKPEHATDQATEQIPEQGEKQEQVPVAPEPGHEQELVPALPEGTLAPNVESTSTPTTELSAEKHETEQEQPTSVESQPQIPEDINIHHPSDDKDSIFNTIVDNLEEKTTLQPALSVDQDVKAEEAPESIVSIESTIPSVIVDQVPEEVEKPHEPPTKHTELVGTIVPESESGPTDAQLPEQPSAEQLPEQPSTEKLPEQPEPPSEALLPEQPEQPSEALLPEQPSEELIPEQPQQPSDELLPEQPEQPSEENLPEQTQNPVEELLPVEQSEEKLTEQTQKPIEELLPAQPQPADGTIEVELASSTSQPEEEIKQEDITTVSSSPQEHEEGEQKVGIATESVPEDNVPSLSSTILPDGSLEIITEAPATPSKDESHIGDEILPTEQPLPHKDAQDGEAEAPIQTVPKDQIAEGQPDEHIIPTELTEKPQLVPEEILPEEHTPENLDQGELPQEEIIEHVTEENLSQGLALEEHTAAPEEPLSVDRVSEADNVPKVPASEEATVEQGTASPEEEPAAQTVAPALSGEEQKPAVEEQAPEQAQGSEEQTPEPALGLEEQTPENIKEQAPGSQEHATEPSPALEEHTSGLDIHLPAGEGHTLAPEYHVPQEVATESIAPEENIAVDGEPSPTQESSTLTSIEEKLPELSAPVESIPEKEQKPEVEHVTGAAIDATSLPESQTEKSEVPAAQPEVPDSEGLAPESVTVAIDERIRPETTISSIEVTTSSPSDKLHGELPASTTSLPIAEEAGKPESDAVDGSQRPEGVEISSADLTTQPPLEDKASTQGAITEVILDVTQDSSEAPKPEQELPERTTQAHPDGISASTSKPEEEQKPESSPAVEEATPKIISADENVYTTEAYDTLNRTEMHVVDESAPESQEPQSTSPSPTHPAHLPPHSSHDHETQPPASQFGPSGTGSDSQGEGDFGPMPGGHYSSFGDEDYAEEEDPSAFGPGTCRYGGKLFVSAQQIPRDDPCDFCFCFRSDIICLQQSCPPPISGCHEEPISGFCCPRYECPVLMGGVLNLTTTTTTTTTVPPHFQHRPSEIIKRAGCYIGGHSYKVGEAIDSASGPCIQCSCGGDGQMKCEPKVCSPEPMLRHMIAVAASRRR